MSRTLLALAVLGTVTGAARLSAEDPPPAKGWKGAVDPPTEAFVWPAGPLPDIPLSFTPTPAARFAGPGGR
jgi:hypothetical protein